MLSLFPSLHLLSGTRVLAASSLWAKAFITTFTSDIIVVIIIIRKLELNSSERKKLCREIVNRVYFLASSFWNINWRLFRGTQSVGYNLTICKTSIHFTNFCFANSSKLAVRTLMLFRVILHGLVFKETFFSHILLTASPLPFTNRRLSQKVQINNQTDNEI